MSTYLFPGVTAGQELTADLLTDADRLVTQSTYTPTLTATTSTPVIGADGWLRGAWHRTGLLINGWADVYVAGAGSSIVGTSWRVSLPFAADTSLHVAGLLDAEANCIGLCRTRSATAAQSGNFSAILGSTASQMIFYGAGTNTSLGNADFTTTARMHVRFTYVADPAAF